DPDVEQVVAGLALRALAAVGAHLERFALDRQAGHDLLHLRQELGGGLLRRLVVHGVGVLGAGASGEEQARQGARDGETPRHAKQTGLHARQNSADGRSAEPAAHGVDLVVVAGHDVGLVAQRFGAGIPVFAVPGGADGGDALAAEAPVDRAVAVHFGVADRIVARRAGPEVVGADVHVADVVDQRAVDAERPPAGAALVGLVAHARAAHGDDVVDGQALARHRVGGADHGRTVGVADHG